jgi:hypothetical protein
MERGHRDRAAASCVTINASKRSIGCARIARKCARTPLGNARAHRSEMRAHTVSARR